MHFDSHNIAIRYSQFGVFCVAVVFFAGCGANDSSQTKLEFWAIGSEVEIIGDMFDDFRRENPDIDLRVQQIPWLAAHEKLLTAFAGDTTPDLCQLGNTWIPELVALNALEPLDRYAAASPVVRADDYLSLIHI